MGQREAGDWPAARGRIGPKSFENIRGIGHDAQGNLYVCDIGMAGMCQITTPQHGSPMCVFGFAADDEAAISSRAFQRPLPEWLAHNTSGRG